MYPKLCNRNIWNLVLVSVLLYENYVLGKECRNNIISNYEESIPWTNTIRSEIHCYSSDDPDIEPEDSNYWYIRDCIPKDNETITQMLLNLAVPKELQYLQLHVMISRHLIDPVDMSGVSTEDGKGSLFEGMSTIFPNLTALYIWGDAFSGTLNPKGLEALHSITFWETNIDGFVPELFENFTKLEGLALFDNEGTINLSGDLFPNQSELASVLLYNSKVNSEMIISNTVFKSSPNLQHLSIGGLYTKIEDGLFDTLNQNFTTFSICDIGLTNYRSKSIYLTTPLEDDEETKERFFPMIGSIERMEVVNTGLPLHGLMRLLNGIHDLTSLDLSGNNVTCEDCSNKNVPCDCDNVERLDNLIYKVNAKRFQMINDEGNCKMNLHETQKTNKSLCINYHLIVAICILIPISVLLFAAIVAVNISKRLRQWLYDNKYAGRFFPTQEDGPIYIAYPEDEPEYARILKDVLENNDGREGKANQTCLHGRNYQVIIHERDFPGGKDVTENIHKSMEKAFKTIMILTPAYLQSFWWQHELNIAYAQNKIIMVEIDLGKEQQSLLKEEINKTTIPLMKQYLTYFNNRTLKWKGNVHDRSFWRKLRFELPHKCPNRSLGDNFPPSVPLVQPPPPIAQIDDIQDAWYFPNLNRGIAYKSLKMAHVGNFAVINYVNHISPETNINGDFELLVTGKGRTIYTSRISRRSEQANTFFTLNGDTRMFQNVSDLVNYYIANSHPSLNGELKEPLHLFRQ